MRHGHISAIRVYVHHLQENESKGAFIIYCERGQEERRQGHDLHKMKLGGGMFSTKPVTGVGTVGQNVNISMLLNKYTFVECSLSQSGRQLFSTIVIISEGIIQHPILFPEPCIS